MKTLIALTILATLAACTPTREELVAAWMNECQALGVTSGPYMAACVNGKEMAYNQQVANQQAAINAYFGQLQRQQQLDALQRSQQAPTYSCSSHGSTTTCRPY